MDILLELVNFFSGLFGDQVPDYEAFGVFYGWVGAASATIAAVSAVFVLAKREAGMKSAMAIGQVILVVGFPFMLAAGLAIAGVSG